MVEIQSFKRLILIAVLRHVSSMVIRLVSVFDQMRLPNFHDVFRTILGWRGDLGFIIRVHGQEFNRFRRKTQSQALHEWKLHRQEKFLYICDTLHMWALDIGAGVAGNHLPIGVGGRGAAPPESCGGPTGYRLMLKRQRLGVAMSNPGAAREVRAGTTSGEDANLGATPPRYTAVFQSLVRKLVIETAAKAVLLRKPCSKQSPCFMVFTKGLIYRALATRDRSENRAKMNFAMEPAGIGADLGCQPGLRRHAI
jgi:hypothetical protein